MKLIIIAITSFLTVYVHCQDGFTCDPVRDCALAGNPEAVPDPENCNNFYACNEGALIEESLSCSEGTYFNGDPLTPACIPGVCGSPICTGFTVSDCKTSCHELEEETGYIVFPGTCNSRYYCTAIGTITEVACDDGEFFDGVDCTTVEEDACCSVCGTPICTDRYTVLDKFPDKSSCQNFYVCLNGDAHLQICDEGESFDLNSNECQITADAMCPAIFCDAGTPDPFAAAAI